MTPSTSLYEVQFTSNDKLHGRISYFPDSRPDYIRQIICDLERFRTDFVKRRLKVVRLAPKAAGCPHP